jgi:hypothetical protein
MDVADVWKVAVAILTALGGGAGIVFASSNWLGRVWADRLLEREKAKHLSDIERLKSELERVTRTAQAELDKRIVVHRAHFEAEFRALEQSGGPLFE